jgi:RNA polymerase sigma-70 factor (ECF subfamily)
MTLTTSSMSFLMRERAPVSMVDSSGAPTNASGADAEARRLAAAVARGDEAAFRKLYDGYHPRLLRLVLVLARGDESLAREVVQSAFLTAAKKLRHTANEAHLWNWLARVARQHLAKHWRHQRRNSTVVAVTELPECADAVAPDATLERCLDAALLEMTAEELQLIEKFYFDRLSQKEIAEQLGVTPKAVSGRLERARDKLRLLTGRNLSCET